MIVCCGEALIDMVPGPDADDAPVFAAHTGGAVFNTAIALGRLETPVALVSGVSTDPLGQMLAQALTDSDVRTDLLVRSARATTLAMVHLCDGHATYSFYDENSAGRMVRPSDLPALPADAEALFFGGISLCMTPVADALVDYAERHAGTLPIMVDPNARPGFAEDEASYRTRLTRLLGCADLVKVSDDDLDWLFPGQSDAQKRDALFALGPAVIFVTRGGAGADAWLADGRDLHVDAPATAVVDTIGAGDTFNAGILAHLQASGHLTKAAVRNPDPAALTDAMALAVRAAAVTVSRAGANPPRRTELADL